MNPETKLCPFCGETIKAQAIKCRFCGEFLGGTTRQETHGDEIKTGDMDQVTSAAVGRKAQAVKTGDVGGSVIQAQGNVILGKATRDEQYEAVLKWDKQTRLREFDLSGRSLANLNLSGADLTGANLAEADLSETVLTEANLSKANLSGAMLSSTRLYKADLSLADLSGAFLLSVQMGHAKLRFAKLDNAEATMADLSYADLSNASLRGVTFDLGAVLNHADLNHANLSGAYLAEAEMKGVNLFQANLSGAYLPFVDLSTANLKGAQLERAIYSFHTRFPPGFDPARAGMQYERTVDETSNLREVSGLGRAELAAIDRLTIGLRPLLTGNAVFSITPKDENEPAGQIGWSDEGVVNATFSTGLMEPDMKQQAANGTPFLEQIGWSCERSEGDEEENLEISADWPVKNERDLRVLVNNIVAIMTRVFGCPAASLQVS